MTGMLSRKARLGVVGLALAASLAAAPASATPLRFDPALAGADDAPVERVDCTGCWVAGGVAAGVVAGAAIANANRGYYYGPRYGYDGYYGPRYYGARYRYYAPRAYYGPRYYDGPRYGYYGRPRYYGPRYAD